MKITCSEHREKMLLLSLRRRLAEEELTREERGRLEKEIELLEAELGLN